MLIPEWTASDPWPDGATKLFLVGPPGTGKTRSVLETYILPLLRDGASVLATSYTRAAASELRDRAAKALGGAPEDWRRSLSTIHSESYQRCKSLGVHSDKDRIDPEESNQDEITGILARIAETVDRDALSMWEEVRQRWPEDMGLSVEERLKRIPMGRDDMVAAVAAVRRDRDGRHNESGVLVRPDFTDALELAMTNGDDRRLDLLAVDEAQDLTPLQWALIDKWSQSATRLLVVGDPDQALYAWAGADGARLRRWITGGLPARRLAQSWRVPRAAHRLARQVVLGVTQRVDAPYSPADRDGSVEQVDPIGAWEQVAQAQADGRSVLVLSRTNRGAGICVDGLRDNFIPHIAERGRRLLGGSSDSPSRTLACATALNDLACERDPEAPDAKALVTALCVKGGPGFSLHGAKSTLDKWLTGKRSRVTSDALRARGLDVDTLVDGWNDPSPKWWDAALLEKKISTNDLLAVRDLLIRYGDSLMGLADLVRVTTCHGSKGREADLVVLDARSCFYQNGKSLDERDEDRRVLYVAVTRTRDRLLIIRGDRRDWLDQHSIRIDDSPYHSHGGLNDVVRRRTDGQKNGSIGSHSAN